MEKKMSPQRRENKTKQKKTLNKKQPPRREVIQLSKDRASEFFANRKEKNLGKNQVTMEVIFFFPS